VNQKQKKYAERRHNFSKTRDKRLEKRRSLLLIVITHTWYSLCGLDMNNAFVFRVGTQPISGAAAVRVTLEVVRRLLQDRLQEVDLLRQHRFYGRQLKVIHCYYEYLKALLHSQCLGESLPFNNLNFCRFRNTQLSFRNFVYLL
jgi:hypothetical protein